MFEVINGGGPQPPDNLPADGGGRRLWDSVIHAVGDDGSTYVLRPDELRILEDACWLADTIDQLKRDVAAARHETRNYQIVRGSTGQQKVHPLLARADKAEDRIARYISVLKGQLIAIKLFDLASSFDDDQSDTSGAPVASTG